MQLNPHTDYNILQLFCSWYFGKISRHMAEVALQHPEVQQGSYLIRQSITQSGIYSLSVWNGVNFYQSLSDKEFLKPRSVKQWMLQ